MAHFLLDAFSTQPSASVAAPCIKTRHPRHAKADPGGFQDFSVIFPLIAGYRDHAMTQRRDSAMLDRAAGLIFPLGRRYPASSQAAPAFFVSGRQQLNLPALLLRRRTLLVSAGGRFRHRVLVDLRVPVDFIARRLGGLHAVVAGGEHEPCRESQQHRKFLHDDLLSFAPFRKANEGVAVWLRRRAGTNRPMPG
ncbi:hypothetical protein MPL3365_450012 [Mesorhizobium plurifarium]|uniref:Uncharacterized protein n=1 Tax=Mesorhizobium plurifarium TaxID=69974 RepID=A0A090GA88_MESPL|nr:hypothetical protein MPL3365_450012 [Mesorhizobium plurifarium]